MKTKTVVMYTTADGKEFDDLAAAAMHEAQLQIADVLQGDTATVAVIGENLKHLADVYYQMIQTINGEKPKRKVAKRKPKVTTPDPLMEKVNAALGTNTSSPAAA